MQQTKHLKTHLNDVQSFGYYLAGVWEGDGNVGVKADRNKPTLHITMHIEQAPYLNKLLNVLERQYNHSVGNVSLRPENNSAVLNIVTPEGLAQTLGLIHQKCKTPKAHQLNVVAHWLNVHQGYNFGISKTEVFNLLTPWFAGFCEADGSFGVDRSTKTRLKVSCQFQINQRLCDPKTGHSYGDIINCIAKTLHVKRHTFKDKKSGQNYYAIKATSRKTKDIIQGYFKAYPLLSSKRLDYDDWCCVDALLPNLKKNAAHVNSLKAGMNRSRTKFTWQHLCFIEL
jgi:LAGLIDADG endonuclease